MVGKYIVIYSAWIQGFYCYIINQMINKKGKFKNAQQQCMTHIGFVVAGLKDELLGVMLPVLHRSG